MSDWKTWSIQAWNERLLAYFFRSHDEQSPPVVVLLVTAEELARAAGDTGANAEEVRDAFVEAMRMGIRRSGGNLLDNASNYQGWPAPPSRGMVPRFVAHLLLSCIAASESTDDLRDEHSFLIRLRDLTEDQVPDNSLEMLPRLWEHLATWLASNEPTYRKLHLPNPGGLRRIGYSVKLAFPDRRDQRHLSELLDRAGLAGHEPPVGRVLSLVATERARFRPSFLKAFDEFRLEFNSSSTKHSPRLVEHRFWAAVREASLRGRGQEGFVDPTMRVSLLGEEQDDQLVLFIVADDSRPSSEFGMVELPIAYGDWRFALVPKGTETAEAELLKQTTIAVLSGKLRLPKVSSYVEQGLLPFAAGTHGLLELIRQDQLPDASVALVREELVADVVSLFGRRSSKRRSAYEGWAELHGLSLRAVPSLELDDTSLRRTWILHESLFPVSIRVVGGVRTDDGWLGAHEVLPRVITKGASSVVLEGTGGREVLAPVDDGWTFPPRDIAGEFKIVAQLEGGIEEQRTIRFNAAPASEAFKAPSEPDAWITEGMGGTVTLSTTFPLRATLDDHDCQEFCERLAHLGADVGVFVNHAQDAAWDVVNFGGRNIGAQGQLRGGAAIPAKQVTDAHARRRWRKMLFQSDQSWSDAQFEQARRVLKGRACSHDLPRIEVEQAVPEVAQLRLSPPSSVTDRLVRVISGRASTRAGIDWRDWHELAQRVLNIDARQLAHVTRAWMEAGLIDVASYARWWHRSIFVRKPRLIGFRVGDHVGAALSGLALPATRDDLQRAAIRTGALVEERFSVSPFVPRTIALRLQSRRALQDLGHVCRLEVCWLDLDFIIHGGLVRHDGTSAPPEHYEHVNLWPRWSLIDGEHSGVTVEHCMRSDRPDFWLVSQDDKRVWSYDLNFARAWAATFLAARLVSVIDDSFIEAAHAYLPLPLARAVGVLGSGLPGAAPNGTYRYPIGVPGLRKLVLEILSRTFDPSRLVASTAQQAS